MKKAALVLTLLLAGCAGGARETVPEWVDGSSDKYPEVRYLTGQGQASSAALARDRARAELAKVFATRVSERSEDVASAEVITEGGDTRQRSETRVDRSVQTETQRLLEGVRIAETWRDPDGTYHALAVLDRLTESDRLRTRIGGLDQVIERAVARARGSDHLLARLGAASQAVAAQQERDALQQDLRVIDPTGIGVPARYERARLQADFAELAARLRVAVEAEADPIGNLASVMQGAVRHAGFINAPAGEADYRLVSSLVIDTSVTDGWQWVTGTLELRMLDKSGQVLGTQRWPVKASAQQAATARHRAISEVDRQLRAKLRETVIGFAEGLR
ncbi:MAG: LPP20 family lipoprotein [Thiohalomonadaceae bacterium]